MKTLSQSREPMFRTAGLGLYAPARLLQRWAGWFHARRQGHNRMYSFTQALQVAVLSRIRSARHQRSTVVILRISQLLLSKCTNAFVVAIFQNRPWAHEVISSAKVVLDRVPHRIAI